MKSAREPSTGHHRRGKQSVTRWVFMRERVVKIRAPLYVSRILSLSLSLSRFVPTSSLERRRPRKEETKERNEGKVEKRRRSRGLIRGWEACRLVVKPGLITATNYPAVIRTLSGTLSTFCPGDGTSPPAIIRITRRTLEPLKSGERERERERGETVLQTLTPGTR